MFDDIHFGLVALLKRYAFFLSSVVRYLLLYVLLFKRQLREWLSLSHSLMGSEDQMCPWVLALDGCWLCFFCFGCSDLSLNLFLFYNFLHSIAVFKSMLICSAHFFFECVAKKKEPNQTKGQRARERERGREEKNNNFHPNRILWSDAQSNNILIAWAK